jgi:uncharacterized DUF497 family protein
MGIQAIFEWYERKRSMNLRKHGLDFADCAQVFAKRIVTDVDGGCDYGETRYRTLGLLDGRVVNVVHTESDEFVRLISMRKATKREQAYYFQAIQD